MAEIVGKFGAAMSGFWWSLDEHERRALMLGGVWLAVVALDLLAAAGKDRQRRTLVDDVLQELNHRDH